MKQGTKDQMEGKFHEAKGTVKEKTGHAINNPGMAARGREEKNAGRVQNKVGQAEKALEK